MAAAVPVRADYDAARLRALAKQSADADQTRRLLALAVIYDGLWYPVVISAMTFVIGLLFVRETKDRPIDV